MVNCSICGLPPSAQPFQYTPDNNWSYNDKAHHGCVNKRKVDESAKQGFGIDREKDGPNTRSTLEFVPSSQETDDGESGEGEPEGPDPDLQAG